MVGTGECFDLANQALKNAGAKSASDFGTVTPDADYVWGSTVQLAAIRPGDVLQYRNYVQTRTVEVKTTINLPDGGTLDLSEETSVELKRPHHTSIVASPAAKDLVKVVEQNVDRGRGSLEKLVDVGEIYLKSQPSSTTSSKKAIQLDLAWAEKTKKLYRDPKDKKYIDDIVRKNLGKSVNADVKTTETVEVQGTLKAYRPQIR
jgi:hypothetical protein